WSPPETAPAGSAAPNDPWAKPKRQDQRTAVLRLKRVLMSILAEQGTDLPIAPDGPVVRMVDQNALRAAFYSATPVAQAAKQARRARHAQFKAALAWAEQERLIGIGEVEEVPYAWLNKPGEDEG